MNLNNAPGATCLCIFHHGNNTYSPQMHSGEKETRQPARPVACLHPCSQKATERHTGAIIGKIQESTEEFYPAEVLRLDQTEHIHLLVPDYTENSTSSKADMALD
jgi:hypothetical protein